MAAATVNPTDTVLRSGRHGAPDGLEPPYVPGMELAGTVDVASAGSGFRPGDRVMAAARSLDLTGVDAVVLSACVQMPSLDLIEAAEQELGVPVISAATAGAYSLLRATGLPLAVAGAGSLLGSEAAAVQPA